MFLSDSRGMAMRVGRGATAALPSIPVVSVKLRWLHLAHG